MEALLLLFSLFADLARTRGRKSLAEGIELARDLAAAGKEGSEEFRKLCDDLRAKVEAGQDPTPEEMSALRTRRAELSAELRAMQQAPDPTANLPAGGPTVETPVAAGPDPGNAAQDPAGGAGAPQP